MGKGSGEEGARLGWGHWGWRGRSREGGGEEWNSGGNSQSESCLVVKLNGSFCKRQIHCMLSPIYLHNVEK